MLMWVFRRYCHYFDINLFAGDFFFYSDQPILTAAALDIVGEGVATTTLGSLSFARFVLSASSPIIAGFLYDNYSMDHVFYYVAALMISAALLLVFVPF
ncbi:MAG: hypothetical protein CM1200mP3_00750 [Chloroflexota bacterium]|nr:MAG: hypothetical protein CM1200mP3_00750 [Chloroflexota bacterium]